MKKNRLLKVKKIVVMLLLIVLAVVLALLAKYRMYQKKLQEKAETMNRLATETIVTVADDTEEKETAKYDFEKLRETNKDIYAWITIPDTMVDYPVLQSETDNKYLDTNIDGSQGYPGCIYSNKCNSKKFDDYITVLYGHNMKSGEMFGSLHQFGEEEFFDDFDTYSIETESARYIYSVYAVVNYNDSLITAKYGVKTREGRDAFIQSLEACRGNSSTHFHDEVNFKDDDQVLVLSVCISGQKDRRLLVVSKLEEIIEF